MTRTTHSGSKTGQPARRVGVALLMGALALAVFSAAGCTKSPTTESQPSTTESATTGSASSSTEASTPAETSAPAETVTELQIKDTKVGKGAAAKAGDTVTVHYTGWLMDGTKFDSSVDRNEPFTFQLGSGQVIEGWDKGVAGMKVGGTRVLIIPSSMGYGEQGAPPAIPANATLKFEVKLLAIQ